MTSTPTRGQAKVALDALKFMDFVFLIWRRPMKWGTKGNAAGKIQAIEFFDETIVGSIPHNIGSLGDAHPGLERDDTMSTEDACRRSQSFCRFILTQRGKQGFGSPFTEACARKTGIVVHPVICSWDNFIRTGGHSALSNFTQVGIIYSDTMQYGPRLSLPN